MRFSTLCAVSDTATRIRCARLVPCNRSGRGLGPALSGTVAGAFRR